MFFDPDDFAVYCGYDGETVELPGKPLTLFGRVRDVVVDPLDLPVRCVCFNIVDMQQAIGGARRAPQTIRKNLLAMVNAGDIPHPIFDIIHTTRLHGPAPFKVYLYPEALAIYRAFIPEGEQVHRHRVGVFAKHRQDMLNTIHAARMTALETIE